MEKLNADSRITLRNGTKMPIIGFGVFRIPEGEEVVMSVQWALQAGYRMIDGAKKYENENSLGKAIRESGISREEIFVTTKLWNSDQGYENTLKAIDVSLEKLGLDYVDLYLIHWPTADNERKLSINKREETWKAMEEIYKSGKAKAIGVSNYMISHLEEMKNYATIMPMVDQVEFHPFLYKEDLLNYCKEHNVVLQAHSPLADNMSNDNDVAKSIAAKHSKSTSQIFIRWSIQHGVVPLPKSTHKERIIENISVFDFELTGEDMKKLNGLNANLHVRFDPTNFT